MTSLFRLVFVALVLMPLLAAAPAAADEGDDMALVFWERFNDPALPLWVHRGQEYRSDSTYARGDPRAVKVKGGILHLRTIRDPARPGYYLNGHIGTDELFHFTYGLVTARVRFHPYHGTHAAFWLAPSTDYVPGQSEVDIAEYVGTHTPGKTKVEMRHNVIHGEQGGLPGSPMQHATIETSGTWYKEFHDYSVRWTPEAYTFLIDGEVVGTITSGLSDQPHYLVLSMLTRDFEVGDMHHHPIESYDTEVKWIKVWQ